MAVVTLKKGEGRTIKSGGMWIFDNEIASIMGSFEDGDIVIVHDFDGYPMGKGFINRNSKIRVRLMTRNTEQEIDDAFLRERLENAWEYRKKTVDTSSCRVVFGEADFLPGLVIDKFSDVLVVQSLALGIDRFKERIVDILKAILEKDGINIRGVYERSDAKVRKNEGLPRIKGFIGDEFDTNVQIVENGVKYYVDVKEGQKTGFFLDQKYNRQSIRKLCKDAKVLDCFTHTGSFALNAGQAGAKSVLGLDASELGVEQARKNAELNGLSDTVKFECADVFDKLPELEKAGEKFDVVILEFEFMLQQLSLCACLPSCQNATALAAATFKESTPCAIGMHTVSSHVAIVSGARPSPSVPSTIASLSSFISFGSSILKESSFNAIATV